MTQTLFTRSRFLFSLALCFLSLMAFSQDKFKVGDVVEASYAGDWYRAEVTGGYTEGDFGPTYEVTFKDFGRERLATKWVRSLFRKDIKKQFQAGDLVEFRRWNDKVYEGTITGIDGDKYEVSYLLNGTPSKEWVSEIAVRESKKAVTTHGKAAGGAEAVVGKLAYGQRYKIGQRVMYDELGFLVTRSYGFVVAYDAQKRLYTIKDEDDPSLRYSYPCYNVLAENEEIDNSFFIGKWDVRIRGAITSSDQDNKRTTTVSGGMRLYPLEIKAGGTYAWRVSSNRVITGKWAPRQGVPGITIFKGIDGLDWTVYETTEAFGTTPDTRDEIGFHNLPTNTGYYVATRMGPNRSCVLKGRVFR